MFSMFSMTVWGIEGELMVIDHDCLEALGPHQLKSQQPPSQEKHEER